MDEGADTTFAIVQVPSKADVVRLQRLLAAQGFGNVSFVKEVPSHLVPDNEANAVVEFLGSAIPGAPKPKIRHKSAGRRKIVRDSSTPRATENGALHLDAVDAAGNGPALTAAVIAALSNIAQGFLLNTQPEESDGGMGPNEVDLVHSRHYSEPQASSSSTNSNDHSPDGTTTIPSPIPFVARPRGSRMQTNDDPTVYAACKLCSNKIMSSRLSNLTNHVRRHAALKQYQCCHCAYSHNEMAKVRLHMQHNHADYESPPIDGMCKEMQQQWANLMEQCFPGHAKRFAQNNSFVAIPDDTTDSSKTVSENETVNAEVPETTETSENDKLMEEVLSLNAEHEHKYDLADPDLFRPVSPTDVFPCSDCGEFVQSAKLMTHLVEVHTDSCHSFACAAPECAFIANAPWKVILHIHTAHNFDVGENSVVMTPSGTNYVICVPLFFPGFAKRRGHTIEDEILRQEYITKCLSRIKHDLTLLKAVRCELCFKLFTSDQNISVLLSHARNHFGISTYTCPECPYKANESTAVASHLKRKHSECRRPPIDSSIEQHAAAWKKLACLCFPNLVSSLTETLGRNVKRRPEGGGGGERGGSVAPRRKHRIVCAANGSATAAAT